MGLFVSLKKTYVSSVAYNMAGPEEDRINYLKTTILGNIVGSNNKFSMAEVLTGSYMRGPGLKLKSYHRWALKNYGLIGVPMDTVIGAPTIDPSVVKAAIATLGGGSSRATVEWVTTGDADVTYFARAWLQNNEPDLANTNWKADFIEATGDILISFEAGSSWPPILFTPPVNYIRGKSYVYAGYVIPPTLSQPSNFRGTPKTFIYNLDGTFPDINAQFLLFQTGGRYVPYIPVRVDNKFLSETYEPAAYALAKKAYKKSIGGSYDDLIEKIADNPELNEIDFAYVVFGVSLNTKEMSARRYIFEYFLNLKENQLTSPLNYLQWTGEEPGGSGGSIQDFYYGKSQWDNWTQEMQTVPEGEAPPPQPARQPIPSIPTTTIQIRDQGTFKSNLDMKMTWQGMDIVEGTGLGRPGAKNGDVWFSTAGIDTFDVSDYSYGATDNINVNNISITKQMTANTWKRIDIIGMVHTNMIYNGKSVEISAVEALLDEEESGFIVPLRYSTLQRLSIVDLTQMSTACVNMVFNCYQIVKKRWYQRGWFKVFLIVVAIIITIATGGLGAGSAGLLGTNAGVGAALGFAGVAAVVAGAIANAIAAIIVSKLIMYVSVELFGDKIGTIIAIIATVITLQIGSSFQTGASLASSWTSLLTPQNIMNLTIAAGDGYAGMIASSAQDYMQKTQDILSDYAKQQKELEAKQAEVFGSNTVKFDPLSLVGANPFFAETVDSFLSRTLMTGSDVAELSHRMIDGYADATLSTQLT